MILLFVGLGGAVGSIFRYLLSTIPVHTDFPVLTLATNFLGSCLIGVLAELAKEWQSNFTVMLPLLKTGFCGGFTTFSTFSLETVTLFEQKRFLAGGIYAVFSLVLCFAGILLGQWLARALRALC